MMHYFRCKAQTFLILLCCFFVSSPAFAGNFEDKVIDGVRGEQLLLMLEKLGWIPDGVDNGRYLYVLFTPTCHYCRLLYQNSRNLTDKMQFRWIPVDPSGGLDALYEKPDAETLHNLMMKGTLPENKNAERNKRVRQYTVGGVIFQTISGAIADSPSELAFPTLLYGSDSQCFVISGMPQDIDAMITEVPAQKGSLGGMMSFGVYDAAVKPPVTILPSTKATYGNESEFNEEAVARLMPTDFAPRLASFSIGETGLPVLGVTENYFVVISLDGKEPHFYIRDDDFVIKYRKK